MKLRLNYHQERVFVADRSSLDGVWLFIKSGFDLRHLKLDVESAERGTVQVWMDLRMRPGTEGDPKCPTVNCS